MKKTICLLLAFIMALGFASMGSTLVEAKPITQPSQPDPYALPAGTGTAITTAVLGQPVLPGTTQLSSGKFSPVGFAEGFAQYGGPGLKLSGVTYPATASVCFPFRSFNFKWTGKIYQWNETNSAWVALATSFPEDADGVSNWACTSGAGNGIYSLIIWYIGPPEPIYSRPT